MRSSSSSTHTRFVAAVSLAAAIAVIGAAHAQERDGKPFRSAHVGQQGKELTAADFEQHAPRGFGDPNNSWPQSMIWWRNALYVGTTRQSLCGSLFAIYQFAAGLLGKPFADTWLPYPPRDPDLTCAPDGADLSLQAEIWRWTPDTDSWLRVFQSPLELDNPGTGGTAPPRTGKKVPYEIAIRGLTAYKEPDGTRALYAFGVNSTVMWDRSKLPPPRILRSTDGLSFVPIPQTPGTFLGDLPFNPDHSSFRSPVSYRGKLFVLCGPIFGQGALIGSADPAQGDDAWFLASPPEMLFYEMAVFNGWLYLGTFNPFGGGYSVVKTRAEGPPPYEFITVVPNGAYLQHRPSKSVVSMHEFQGRLYVGTATQTELIRINPDDTWDLVMGQPREVPSPDGGSEWKYPISGLDAGFGHSLNDHAWQMDDPYKHMYIGTYNATLGSKDDPVHGPLLAHNTGAHLYRTAEGWYYSAVTTDGFTDPSDPQGGRFDYGIRTMETTPHGVFVGTTNDHYGLAIFRATRRGREGPDAPDRVEIEPTQNGSALLSWQAGFRGETYQIWRAERHPIQIRVELNFENWNGTFGTLLPDTYIGPYSQIGVSRTGSFTDTTVETGKRYMYYVIAQTKRGALSEQSNLVAFPLLTPPVTFAQMLDEIDRWDQRGRFDNRRKRLSNVRRQMATAQRQAEGCQINDAIRTLTVRSASEDVAKPEAIDFEILTDKLVRRLQLFRAFPGFVISEEFCASPNRRYAR